MNNELIIIAQPSKNKIMVARAIDPEEGALLVDNIAFNAMLVAFANSYEEAEQIIKNLEG